MVVVVGTPLTSHPPHTRDKITHLTFVCLLTFRTCFDGLCDDSACLLVGVSLTVFSLFQAFMQAKM